MTFFVYYLFTSRESLLRQWSFYTGVSEHGLEGPFLTPVFYKSDNPDLLAKDPSRGSQHQNFFFLS